MESAKEFTSECLQNERAFCSAECPFNLDVRDFVGKIQQGRFNVAYRTYQNTVGFPGIVSALCSEPCKQHCPMKDAGGSISIRLLETASIKYARNTEPDQYNMPPKDKRIAIIGGGISGLACALRLTSKKYLVTVYEKSERIGGHLHQLLAPEILLDDINRQFKFEDYTLILNTEVTSLDDLSFDAVYIATGNSGSDFGLYKNPEGAFATNRDGVFIGGSITGSDTMKAIADGLNVAGAIERYLKTGYMNHPEELIGTKLLPEGIRIIKAEQIRPSDVGAYTKDEAITEAKRCLRCACDACVHYSPLMSYFKKFPKRIADEVEVTIRPSTLDGNGTVATRLIATCNHCGLCKEVCPKDIDVGEFLLTSHRTMRKKGAMPWAFHEFYLRDMEFSNKEAALSLLPPGHDQSLYVFFPGCQLGASDPRYVTESYRFLTNHYPDTALMLNCCGAPADWAGDETIHRKALDKIRANWTELGKPTAVFACPMCKQMFQRYLPEIKGEFLYDIIAEKYSGLLKHINRETASIFDPCASRYEPDLQRTIRDLAIKEGFDLEPLPMEGKLAECCSFGGQVAVAYPPYASHSVKKRIEQNNKPYITYCSNCRDIFTAAKKQTWHILDIIFDLDNENRALPSISERRNNRLMLKQLVLNEFWKENIIMEKPETKLYISTELKEKFNKELILETDIYTVIEYCEQNGKKLFDPNAKTFSGYLQIGNMTYWVEYRAKQEFGFEVVNAYCHRMKIEED
ncbi:MAG: pyridine nucleotide-disulfide oxidoreductase/dicluster-binding protein [Bacteroidales bacterium]